MNFKDRLAGKELWFIVILFMGNVVMQMGNVVNDILYQDEVRQARLESEHDRDGIRQQIIKSETRDNLILSYMFNNISSAFQGVNERLDIIEANIASG